MNHFHLDERRQIAAELELALAELAVIMAEQDGFVDAVPPFSGRYTAAMQPPPSESS